MPPFAVRHVIPIALAVATIAACLAAGLAISWGIR